jgi:hypothetical protein
VEIPVGTIVEEVEAFGADIIGLLTLAFELMKKAVDALKERAL